MNEFNLDLRCLRNCLVIVQTSPGGVIVLPEHFQLSDNRYGHDLGPKLLLRPYKWMILHQNNRFSQPKHVLDKHASSDSSTSHVLGILNNEVNEAKQTNKK